MSHRRPITLGVRGTRLGLGESRVKITCLIDNSVSRGDVWAEHGLSMLIESRGGRVLFDVGASGTVLKHNAAVLKLDLSAIDAVVFSHGHRDHTGGMEAVAGLLSGKPLVAHPDVFVERFGGRDREPIGLDSERGRAISRTLRPVLDASPRQVLGGVRTTGEIVERPCPEGRGSGHVVRSGEDYVPDPYQDDLSLVLSVRDGVVVVLGCAHAGVLNILATVRRQYRGPILAVIGGTHLGSADRETLQLVAREMEACGSPKLYLNHCTGADSLFHLRYLMPDRVRPFGAGAQVEFAEEALA